MLKEIERMLKTCPEVYGHSLRVRNLATNFAIYLGYSLQEVAVIYIGAFLHDIGKLKVPTDVLLKNGSLTDEEFETIKHHPEWGYELLKKDFNEDILAIVLQHHEWINGQGYPNHLKGEEIHPYAKLIALCDTFDAITHSRSYKVAYSAYYALSEIEKHRGTQFDAELATKFIEFIYGNYDFSRHLFKCFVASPKRSLI